MCHCSTVKIEMVTILFVFCILNVCVLGESSAQETHIDIDDLPIKTATTNPDTTMTTNVTTPTMLPSNTTTTTTTMSPATRHKNLVILYATIFSVVGFVAVVVICVVVSGCRKTGLNTTFRFNKQLDQELGTFQDIPRAKVRPSQTAENNDNNNDDNSNNNGNHNNNNGNSNGNSNGNNNAHRTDYSNVEPGSNHMEQNDVTDHPPPQMANGYGVHHDEPVMEVNGGGGGGGGDVGDKSIENRAYVDDEGRLDSDCSSSP